MIYCSNCGTELPDGTKYCTNCGTPVGNADFQGGTSGNENYGSNREESYLQQNVSDESQSHDSYETVDSNQSRSTPQNETMYQEHIAASNPAESSLVTKIDRLEGVAGIVLAVLAFVSFAINMPFFRIIVSAVVAAACIFCLSRKYRHKKTKIVALVLATLCLAGGVSEAGRSGLFINSGRQKSESGIGGGGDSAGKAAEQVTPTNTPEPTKAPTSTPTPIPTPIPTEPPAEENVADTGAAGAGEADEATEGTENEEDTGEESTEVTPELKEFLDSYEAFIDKYVEFMKNYDSNSDNAIAMLGDYLEIMKELAEFEEALDQYDSDDMSTADALYYLEVTTRCSQKMLAALG